MGPEKNFGSLKYQGPERIYVQENLGPKKIWCQKIICPKNFESKNFGSQIIWVVKKFDREKFVSRKNFGPEKKLGPEENWVSKMSRTQKNLGPKTFGSQKIWYLKIWFFEIFIPNILSWVGLSLQVQGSVSLFG